MENQVEEIKKKLDAVDVISKYLPLQKKGRHFVARCPFHAEKTPSFIVSPELQIFKCFGCGKGGDIYTFVQEFERVNFAESLEILARLAGVTLIKSTQLSSAEYRQKRLLVLHEEVARFYHYVLTSHPLGHTALQYVLKRGITLPTIKLFRLGYSPKNPEALVKHLLKKDFKEPELLASGIFGKSQYRAGFYDRFTDRLTFPLADSRGRVLGFSGRSLPGSKPDLAKYINSPETDLYHKGQMVFGLHLAKESIKKQKAVIVTEGEFDMISPFQAGFTNIVALKGTAFTPDQLQLLHRYTDTLVLALDSDFAGSTAAKKSILLADSLDFDIHVLDLGKYKDPDEAIRGNPQFFQDQCKSPLPIWDFFISSAVKSFGVDTPKGKRQILADVLPLLARITNSVIRSDYLKKLSVLINSDYDAVLQEASKYLSGSPKTTTPTLPAGASAQAGPAASVSQVEKLEEYLLSLVFAAKKPQLVAKRLKPDLDNFLTSRFQNLVSHLLSISSFDVTTFHQQLPAEIQPVFQHLYLLGTNQNFDSPTRKREIAQTIHQLRILHLKDKLQSLSQKLGSDDSNPTLESEYRHLVSQLSQLQLKK